MVKVEELVEAYFENSIFIDGNYLSLNEKKEIWHSTVIEEQCNFISGELQPHLFLTKALKALQLKKSILIQPCGIRTDISEISSHRNFDVGLFTSGSSGMPKFIQFGIEQLLTNAMMHTKGYSSWAEIEYVLQTLPLNHSYGFVALALAALLTNKGLFLYTRSPLLNQIPFEICSKSFLPVTPSQIRLNPLIKEKLKPGILSVGSSAIVPSDMEKIRQKFFCDEFYVTYGLTEAGPRVTAGKIKMTESLSFENGSYIGSPLPGVKLTVKNSHGEICKEGTGHLIISSPSLAISMMDPCLNNSYQTEDLVTIQDNKVFYHDRASSIIKKAGHSISALYIESKLREINGVEDCFVFKRKSLAYDELPIVFYSGPINQRHLMEQLKHKLPLDWWPDQVTQVTAIPRKGLNKVHREELFRMVEAL